jgi:outer membrane receptor for ferrienterochelin and colicins
MRGSAININRMVKAKNYWFFAAMIERKFKRFSLVLNGENLADFRQSRYETLYTGLKTNPQFRSLWAPIDGRVLNMSLKINLL